MRRVSIRGVLGGAFLVLAPFLIAVPTNAEEPNPSGPPPNIRIMPPIGVAEPVEDPTISADLREARIKPPGGLVSQIRIMPPGGRTTPPNDADQGVVTAFWEWLRSQIRIMPPIG